MAEPKGQRARSAQLGSRGKGSPRTSSESIEDVRQERDRLRRELEAARAEVDSLKERQKQVLDRIDWALDTLNSLAEADE